MAEEEKKSEFFNPSWKSNDLDRDMENNFTPGALPMAGAGANNAVSTLMSQLSPLLGSLANLAGIDQKIVEGITRSVGGVLSTRGSFTGGSNLAHQLYNSEQASTNAKLLKGFDTASTDGHTRLTQQIYEKMGHDPATAAIKAKAAMDNPLNPMGLASGQAFDSYGMDQMRRSMTASSLIGGVHVNNKATQDRFAKYSSDLASNYMENKFAFGGLSGGDVGQLQTAMTQRGQLDFKTGGKGNKSSDMVNKVKDMAKAISPLKQLFNESIPQLMERLDEAFGVSTATFSPDQISSKIARMKYTASQTGVSVGQIMGMAGSARQMLGSMGMSGMGADTAAVQAAGMMGSGVNLARLDPQKFRQQVLRDAVGQQGSQAAKELSGAAAIMMRSGKHKTHQAAVDALMAGLGDDFSVGNMAKVAGASRGQIVAAGMSETAEDIRTQTDVATNLTEKRYGDFRTVMGQGLRYRARKARDPKVKKAYATLIAGLRSGAVDNEENAAKALSGMGLSAGQMEAVLGTYKAEGNIAAGSVGFEGGQRGAIAQYNAEQNRKLISDKTEEWVKTEKSIKAAGLDEPGYGLIGMIQNKDGKGTKVSDAFVKAFGLPKLNMDTSTIDALNKETGGASRLTDSVKIAFTNMNKKGVSAKALARYKAMGKALSMDKGADKVAALAKARDDIFLNDTDEGEAVRKVAGFSDNKAFTTDYLKATAPVRERMLKKAGITKALAGMKGDDANIKALKAKIAAASATDDTVNVREMIANSGLEDSQQKALSRDYEKIMKDEAGVDVSETAPDFLKRILAALESLAKAPILGGKAETD